MPVDEEIVLTCVGDEYPSIVREQLAVKDESLNCSASLSENGHAWLIVGKQLYIWRYDTEVNEANSLTALTLPQSGLPFTTRTICVYMQPGSSFPGVIAVSPEGTVRHWSSISRQPVDTSLDLEREVVDSLQPFPENCNGEGVFLLATTTFTFYCLHLVANCGSSPGKKQRIQNGIEIIPFYTKKAESLTRRVTSALFGDSADHGSRLIRAFVHGDRLELTAFEQSLSEMLANVSVLGITAKDLKCYSTNPSVHTWSCNVSKMLANAFSTILWNVSGSRERKDSHFNVRTFIVDAVRIGGGILILAAASNDAVSTHLHFGLAFFELLEIEEQPLSYDWFSILEFPTDEIYRESDVLPIKLNLPRKPSQSSDFNSNLVTVTTKSYVYLARLPSTHSAVGVKSIYALAYNDELISADCDDLYCYLFLREKGICRVRLFPRGFNITAIDAVLSVNKSGRHLLSKNIEHDAQSLNNAFIHFCKTDLDASRNILSEMLESRRTSVGYLCVDYALTVVDDLPDDERWFNSGRLTRVIAGRSVMFGQSFLVSMQVEQKAKVLSMFVLFTRHMDLDTGFGNVLASPLSTTRSTRSQLCELTEKVAIASDLCNYAVNNSVPLFDAAVERLLCGKKEENRKEFLTTYDYFFQKLSEIDAIFKALLEEEEVVLKSCGTLAEKMECIEEIGNILVVCIDAIDCCRDDGIMDLGTDLRWTQEKQILSLLEQHLDTVFEAIREGLKEKVENPRLRREAIVLASFILGEQTQEERLGSRIVRMFLDIDDKEAGIRLAEQFEDYRTLLELTENMSDVDRKAKVEEYKRKFSSPTIHQVLHEHYLKHGHLVNLLEERGDNAENFFDTHPNINWIRKINNGEYGEASEILSSVADKRRNNVAAKKHLLSFAKLAAVCASKTDKKLLVKINDDLKTIKHQEAVPIDVLQCFTKESVESHVPFLNPEELVDAELLFADNDAEGYFRALMVLNTIFSRSDKYSIDVLEKLKNDIWLCAIRRDRKFWKNMEAADNSKRLTDEEKLKLILVSRDLKLDLLDVSENQQFFDEVYQAEETIRNEVPRWRSKRKQLAASSEALFSSYGY